MHDGSEKTLEAVMDYYAGHGNSNPYLDPEMTKIHLSAQDKSDLVEFMKALTGAMPQQAGPPTKE
jgi:cytochrome c peroxidase